MKSLKLEAKIFLSSTCFTQFFCNHDTESFDLTFADVQKLSQWTPWIREPDRSDLEDSRVRLTRYRIACVAQVPDPRLVSTKMSVEKRSCDRRNSKCRRKAARRSRKKGRSRKQLLKRNRTHTPRYPFLAKPNTSFVDNSYRVPDLGE